MSTFKKLFGVEKESIKKNCIILPFASNDILNGLGVSKLSRGKLYGCAQTRDFSVIHSGMGTSLTGDAVLYLKESPCENLFLFGGCGSTGTLAIGAIVSVFLAYEEESFSKSLLSPVHNSWPSFYPNRMFEESIEKAGIFKRANCLTVSSLKLESERLGEFRRQSIDVVDMECSAFFSAARFNKQKALGLLFVTDVVNQRPFYETRLATERKLLQSSIKKGAHFLCDFIRADIQKNPVV
jgi:purine-nucleoside phosphorylase